MERGEERDGRSWKVVEMSQSDSLAEPAKVTTQWW